MNRVDVCNLVVSMVNATARRYNSLKSETPLAKEYLKLHGSAQSLATSIPGLDTEKILIKYNLIDRRFMSIETEYKALTSETENEIYNKYYDMGIERGDKLGFIQWDDEKYVGELIEIYTEKQYGIEFLRMKEILPDPSRGERSITLDTVKFHEKSDGSLGKFNKGETGSTMKKVTKTKKSGISVKTPDKEGQATFKLSRGGEREGAGRKKKEGMEARKVSLSLPSDWWQHIDEMKEQHKMTQSDVLHNLIIPILAITSGGYNTNFIKSEGEVMTAIEKYFRK
jgi:hypothetical protein